MVIQITTLYNYGILHITDSNKKHTVEESDKVSDFVERNSISLHESDTSNFTNGLDRLEKSISESDDKETHIEHIIDNEDSSSFDSLLVSEESEESNAIYSSFFELKLPYLSDSFATITKWIGKNRYRILYNSTNVTDLIDRREDIFNNKRILITFEVNNCIIGSYHKKKCINGIKTTKDKKHFIYQLQPVVQCYMPKDYTFDSLYFNSLLSTGNLFSVPHFYTITNNGTIAVNNDYQNHYTILASPSLFTNKVPISRITITSWW